MTSTSVFAAGIFSSKRCHWSWRKPGVRCGLQLGEVLVQYVSYKIMESLGVLILLVASFHNLLVGWSAIEHLCSYSISFLLLCSSAFAFPLTILVFSWKHPSNYLLSFQKDLLSGCSATHLCSRLCGNGGIWQVETHPKGRDVLRIKHPRASERMVPVYQV